MGEKFKIAFVDNSQAIEGQAIDAGEAKMTAKKEDLKGVKGFLKKLWRYNLARGYYRQKEINTARRAILESGNIFAAAGGSDEDFMVSQEALVDRFLSSYNEAIHEEAGESRRELTRQPDDEKLRTGLKELIDEYVAGNLDEDTLEAEKVRLLNSLPDFTIKKGYEKVGYADNLLTIAKQIKAMIGHQGGTNKLDYDLDIVIGRAVSGVRTEAQYNKVDRILEKLGKSKIGSLVNESTLGLVVAGTVTAFSSAGKSAAQVSVRALGGLGLGAILTGGLAAARESQMLKQERKQHGREKAQGKEFSEKDERRAEMEKFTYETKQAQDILNSLNINFSELGPDNIEQLHQAINSLADLEARIRLSDQQKIDLIAFSSIVEVERERLALDLARARLKVTARRLVNSQKIDFAGNNFDDYLNTLVEAKAQELIGGDQGIREKDRLFQKMRHQRMVKTGAKAAAIGLAVGLVFQEVTSFLRNDQQGFIEGLVKGDKADSTQTMTALEKARTMIFGKPRLDQAQEIVKVGNQQFKVPVGTEIKLEADGDYSIFYNGHQLVGDIRLTPEGQLTAESQAALANKGIDWLSQQNQIAETDGAGDIIHRFKEAFTRIKRQIWYDNDTKIFDKNELRVFWGGRYGSGIDEDGNILLDLRRLTPDGSYHTLKDQVLSADAQDLIKKGGLKVLLSLSKGTQNQVIEIPIGPDGLAVIPKDSLAASLFTHAEGVTRFTGQFMEVAQTMGVGDKGAEVVRILATQVGEGLPDGSTAITELIHNIDIPVATAWKMPPIIPLFGRRPLEPAAIKKFHKPEYAGYYGGEISAAEKEEYEKYLSPRLKADKKAKLNLQEELAWIFEEKRTREPGQVEKVDSIIKQNKLLAELPKDTKMMVCMAVGAVYESDNVYKTLSLYSHQSKEVLAKTVFVLNVNWLDQDEQDSQKLAQIKKTIEEIERIKKDFPQLKIAVFQGRYVQETLMAERGINIHGQFIKDVHDVALRSLQLSGIDHEVYLLSNDADCQGMSDSYLSKLLEQAERELEKDAFLGRIEWDTKRWPDYPGFHLSTRFMQFLDLVSRHPGNKRIKNIPTSGANSMVKASTLAAIGGVDPSNGLGAGADVNVGRRIKYARGADTTPIGYNHVAWLETNGDRAFNYYAYGESVVAMWSDFSRKGYKGRKEQGVSDLGGRNYYEGMKFSKSKPRPNIPKLKLDQQGSFVPEDLERDWHDIVARFEYQINSGVWVYFKDDFELWQRALNFTFGNVRPPRWEIQDGQVKITEAGQIWLKQQLKSFAAKNSQEILYQRGGHRV